MQDTYKKAAAFSVFQVSARFSWPGGYPLVLAMEDGESICPQCAIDHRLLIEDAEPGSSWRAAGAYVHWEGAPIQCAHCGALVESAYGEPEE